MNGKMYALMVGIIMMSIYKTSTAQVFHEPRVDSEWIKPYQPFRIAGNLYYVGTYELGCYLITTSSGNILINTGTAASARQIENNIEALGFKVSDIKILLTTQAHYDHVGAMSALKQLTGAEFMADAADADVLASGGKTDYEMGKYGVLFQPVKPDSLLHNGDIISFGEMQLTMLHHPGHTKGSCSFLFNVKDDKQSYKVLIANMPTIIVDGKLEAVTSYPDIIKDYAYTLHAMKQLQFDIWVASHAGQFDLHEKNKPGDAYNPAAFKDRESYNDELDALQHAYEEKLHQ